MAISDVQEIYSNEYKILDQSGHTISQRSIRMDEKLVGIGTDFYVTIMRDEIYTFDEKSDRITNFSLGGFEVKNIVGNTINLVRGTSLRSYDKHLKLISERTIF
jgi:hypothetical protein